MNRPAPRMPSSRRSSDWPDAVSNRDARIAELEAALRGVMPFTAAPEQRELLRKGIGTSTPSGQAWLAVFSALGEPIKVKR